MPMSDLMSMWLSTDGISMHSIEGAAHESSCPATTEELIPDGCSSKLWSIASDMSLAQRFLKPFDMTIKKRQRWCHSCLRPGPGRPHHCSQPGYAQLTSMIQCSASISRFRINLFPNTVTTGRLIAWPRQSGRVYGHVPTAMPNQIEDWTGRKATGLMPMLLRCRKRCYIWYVGVSLFVAGAA